MTAVEDNSSRRQSLDFQTFFGYDDLTSVEDLQEQANALSLRLEQPTSGFERFKTILMLCKLRAIRKRPYREKSLLFLRNLSCVQPKKFDFDVLTQFPPRALYSESSKRPRQLKSYAEKRARMIAIEELLRNPQSYALRCQAIKQITGTQYIFPLGVLAEINSLENMMPILLKNSQFRRYLVANNNFASSGFRIYNHLLLKNKEPKIEMPHSITIKLHHIHLPRKTQHKFRFSAGISYRFIFEDDIYYHHKWSEFQFGNNFLAPDGVSVSLDDYIPKWKQEPMEFCALVLKFKDCVNPQAVFVGAIILYKMSCGYLPVRKQAINLVPLTLVKKYHKWGQQALSDIRAIFRAQMDKRCGEYHAVAEAIVNKAVPVQSDGVALEYASSDDWRVCGENCPLPEIRQIESQEIEGTKKLTGALRRELKQKITKILDHCIWVFGRNFPLIAHFMDVFNDKTIKFQVHNLSQVVEGHDLANFQTFPNLLEAIRPFLMQTFPAVIVYEFYPFPYTEVKKIRGEIHGHGRFDAHVAAQYEVMRACYKGGFCPICTREYPTLFALLLHFHTSYNKLVMKVRFADDGLPLLIGATITVEISMQDDSRDIQGFEQRWITTDQPSRTVLYPTELFSKIAAKFIQTNLLMDNFVFQTEDFVNPLKHEYIITGPTFLDQRFNPGFDDGSWRYVKKLELSLMLCQLHDFIDVTQDEKRYMSLLNYFLWAVGPNRLKSTHHTWRLFLILNLEFLRKYNLIELAICNAVYLCRQNHISIEECEDLMCILSTKNDPLLQLRPEKCLDSGFSKHLFKRLQLEFHGFRNGPKKDMLLQNPEDHPVLRECVADGTEMMLLPKNSRMTLLREFGAKVSRKDPLVMYKLNSSKVILSTSKPPEMILPREWVVDFQYISSRYSLRQEEQQKTKEQIRRMTADMHVPIPARPTDMQSKLNEAKKSASLMQRCNIWDKAVKVVWANADSDIRKHSSVKSRRTSRAEES